MIQGASTILAVDTYLAEHDAQAREGRDRGNNAIFKEQYYISPTCQSGTGIPLAYFMTS